MLRHNCRFLLHLHNISLICIIWQKSQWNPETVVRSNSTDYSYYLMSSFGTKDGTHLERKAATKYLRAICKAHTLHRKRSFQPNSIVLFLMYSNNFLWINDRKNFTFFLNPTTTTPGFLFWFGAGSCCSFSGVGSNKKLSGYCLLERA